VRDLPEFFGACLLWEVEAFLSQVPMDIRYDHRTLANRRCNTFHRFGSHIADSIDTGNARRVGCGFYLLDEDKQEKISIDERNDHYYDADEEYTLGVTGLLTLKLDINLLADGDMGEDELRSLVEIAEYNMDIDDVTVE
jgi:hypothetical protein